MRRVIIVNTVGLIYDGINSVMLSLLEAMDKTDLQIYVAATVNTEETVVKKYKDLGCRIVTFPNRKKNPIRYFYSLASFIRKHHIDVIHANGNSATLAVEMAAAKIGGCKKRVAHSHNTRCDQVRADRMLRPLFNVTYTDALACGNDAGKWLFRDKPFTVIQNGRNLSKYSFDPEKRKAMREKLGLKDELAVGHVGGFVPQKNHKFLIDIYKEISNRNKNARFFCVGDGPERKEIEEKAKGLDITFTGNIDFVPEFLQAMDIMVLPSLFEGLPLVAVEWQVTGLPFVMSDKVSDEAIFTDFVKTMSLEKSADEWAVALMKLNKDDRCNKSLHGIRNATKKNFDIISNAQQLIKIYMEE